MTCLFPLFAILLRAVLSDEASQLERIPLFFDRNRAVSSVALATINSISQVAPEVDSKLGPIVFENKQHFPPLQAADILAYESMKFRDNQLLRNGLTRKSRERFDRSNWLSFDYGPNDIEEIARFWVDWAVRTGQIPTSPEIRAVGSPGESVQMGFSHKFKHEP